MQQMDPNYQYYVKLEGTYRSEDGKWEAILPPYPHNIEIKYGEGRLESSYTFVPVNPLTAVLGNPSMGLMGMVGRTTPYPGEEIALRIGDYIKCDGFISDGERKLYHLTDAWYGNDTLSLEVTEYGKENKDIVVLRRVICEDNDTFKCVCGYRGDVLNFCPNCGRAVRA